MPGRLGPLPRARGQIFSNGRRRLEHSRPPHRRRPNRSDGHRAAGWRPGHAGTEQHDPVDSSIGPSCSAEDVGRHGARLAALPVCETAGAAGRSMSSPQGYAYNYQAPDAGSVRVRAGGDLQSTGEIVGASRPRRIAALTGRSSTEESRSKGSRRRRKVGNARLRRPRGCGQATSRTDDGARGRRTSTLQFEPRG